MNTYMYLYLYIYWYIYIYINIYIYIDLYIYIYLYIFTYIHMYSYIYMYILVHVYVFIQIYVYIFWYMNIYMYIYVYTYIHGSKSLHETKLKRFLRGKTCFSELKISDPRISCTVNGVRRSSCKGSVGRQMKLCFWNKRQMTDILLMQLASYRYVQTREIKYQFMSWHILFISQFFWYCFLILQHSTMHSIIARASCVNTSSIFWCLFQRRSLVLSPTIPFKNFSSLHSMWNSWIWHFYLNNTLLPRKNLWNLVSATLRRKSMKLTCRLSRFLARTFRPVIYVHIYIYVCVYIYMYLFRCMYIYVYMNIYMCMYRHIYTYIYIYIYM